MYIIAEIAQAHDGSLGNALAFIKQAKTGGADAVKFQMYTADELLSKRHKRYNHFKKQSFTKNDWNEILSSIQKLNKKIYLNIFGLDSLQL